MNQSTHATSFSRRIDVSTLLGSSTLGCHRTSTESYQQKAIDYNLSLLTIGYGCFIYSTLRISIVYRSIDYCSFKTYFEIPSFEKSPSGNRVGVISVDRHSAIISFPFEKRKVLLVEIRRISSTNWLFAQLGIAEVC